MLFVLLQILLLSLILIFDSIGDAGGDGDTDDEAGGEGEEDFDEPAVAPAAPPFISAADCQLLFGAVPPLLTPPLLVAHSLFSTAKITCLPPCTFAGCCCGSGSGLPIEPEALENADEMVEPLGFGEPIPGGPGSAIDDDVPFNRFDDDPPGGTTES